jgi:hypothetical protein
MESKERQALDAKFNGSKSVLTKREQFAGIAMQGLIVEGELSFKSLASIAVKYADGLLEALEESKE